MTEVEVHVVPDARALAVDAAARVADIISATPSALLLAATGETPMGCFAEPNATLPASFLRQHPRATVIADRNARPDGSSHA